MKLLGQSLGNSGASLIETMTAFAIFGLMVLAIYPTFTEIQKIGRNTNVRRLCQQIVTTKLESYKEGFPIDLANYIATAWPITPNATQLNSLSLESYSNDSMGGTNLTSDYLSGASRVLTGFSFSKIRYNHMYPESCIGQSVAQLTSALPQYRYLGFRECIGSNRAGFPAMAWVDGPAPEPAHCQNSAIDMKVSRELPGFKLYVKLELETPWRYGAPETSWAGEYPIAGEPALASIADVATPSIANRLHDRCPNTGNTLAGTSSYDFSGQSDGIKITVTGIIDFPSVGTPPNNLKNVGGVTNPFELTCQSSAVVTPYRYPARYFITNQSKIYSIHGTAWNKSQEDNANARNMVFRNIYQTRSTVDVSASGIDSNASAPISSVSSTAILSIAVHPRDASIWVLRPGQLTRYSNCSDTPINCMVADSTNDATANSAGGFPDLASWAPTPTAPFSTPWAQVQSWNVPTGITSIGVDFRSGRVYGFAKSQSGGVILELYNVTAPPAAASADGSLFKCNISDCTPSPAPGASSGTGGFANNAFRTEAFSRVVDCLAADGITPVICTNGTTSVADSSGQQMVVAVPNPAAVKAEFPRPYFTYLPTRVNSFFMSPSGEAAFVSDNTASMVLGEEVYSASIYRITDQNLSVPIMTLPFYVTGFSM